MNSNKETNYDESYIEHIVRAVENDSFTVFLGAGFSKAVSKSMPSWEELIKSFKKKLGNSISEEENDYLKIAQLYYLKFGENNYHKDIKELIPQEIKIEDKNIVESLFKLRPSRIITTNWDNILENYVNDNAEPYDVIATDNDLLRSELSNKVIKMHGDFDKNNIVFKEDDYASYEKNFPVITNYIKNILTSHTVLFLGYSYSDYNVRNIFSWLKGFSSNRPPIYLFMKENKCLYSQYYNNLGIKLINSEKYEDLPKFLSDILEEKNRGNESILDLMSQSLKDDRTLSISEIKKITKGHFSNFGEITAYVNESDYEIYKQYAEKNDCLNKKCIDFFMYKNFIEKINIYKLRDAEKINLSIERASKNNFSTKLQNIFCFKNDTQGYLYLCEQQKYDELLKVLEKDYIAHKKSKNFFMLMILAQNLELFQNIYNVKVADNRVSKFDNCLENTYISLPKASQIKVHKDYLFLSNFLDKETSKVYGFYKKMDKNVEKINSGGIVFKINISYEFTEHFYFFKFLYENNSLIPYFNEFFTISQEYLCIALYRQINQANYTLNILEVFSFINQRDDMRNKLSKYFGKSEESDSDKNLILNNVNISDLENIGNNLLSNYQEQYNSRDALFEMRLANYFNLLSYVEIDNDFFKKTINIFDKCLDLPSKRFSELFRSFNNYIAEQFNRFKNDIEINELNSLMNKYVDKHFLVNLNIHSSRLSNLVHVCLNSKFKYTNNYKIGGSLAELFNRDLEHFIQGVSQFLEIYALLDEQCMSEVKKVLDSYDFSVSISETPLGDEKPVILFEFFVLISFYKVELNNNTFPNDVPNKYISFLERVQYSKDYRHILSNLKITKEKNTSFMSVENYDQIIQLLNNEQEKHKNSTMKYKDYPI